MFSFLFNWRFSILSFTAYFLLAHSFFRFSFVFSFRFNPFFRSSGLSWNYMQEIFYIPYLFPFVYLDFFSGCPSECPFPSDVTHNGFCLIWIPPSYLGQFLLSLGCLLQKSFIVTPFELIPLI
jgi:hypothetical protein